MEFEYAELLTNHIIVNQKLGWKQNLMKMY